MTDQNPVDDGVPDTLKTAAGLTWRVLVLLLGFSVFVLILGKVFPVVFALFFAMLVTAWASPLMNLLARIMPKVIAMILSLIVISAAILFIIYTVVNASIKEGPALVTSIHTGFSDVQTWLRDGPLHFNDQQIANMLSQAQSVAQTVAKGALGDLLGALGSVGTIVIAGSVFIFGVIFFLLAPQQIWNWVITWVPSKVSHHVDVAGQIAWDSISGYTRGIVVVAFADATLVFIGLSIMQVPLAPALAALVFLGAFIPVIGAPVATFFAAVVALAERGPTIALLVVLLTVVVGSFDGDVLQPLVMGKAVNLHPLAIVIAIAAGSIAMGIVGALVAVPIAGAVYGVSKYLTGRDPAHPFTGTSQVTPSS